MFSGDIENILDFLDSKTNLCPTLTQVSTTEFKIERITMQLAKLQLVGALKHDKIGPTLKNTKVTLEVTILTTFQDFSGHQNVYYLKTFSYMLKRATV